MRGRRSRSGDEHSAWRRLEDAYSAMESAEVELAAALEAVVRQGAPGEAGAPSVVVPMRRRGRRGSEARA